MVLFYLLFRTYLKKGERFEEGCADYMRPGGGIRPAFDGLFEPKGAVL